MLSAAIYTPLSGKGLQAPSRFPEMKVQTSLPNSPNQQLPPAPWLDLLQTPRAPPDSWTPRLSPAPGRRTHIHKLCYSDMQVREGQSPSLLCINSISPSIVLLNTGGAQQDGKGIKTPRHSLSLCSPFLKQKSEYHLQQVICRPSHSRSARLRKQHTLAGRATTAAGARHKTQRAGTTQSPAQAPKGPRQRGAATSKRGVVGMASPSYTWRKLPPILLIPIRSCS